MEDLYKVLNGMEEAVARGLADHLEKYVKGSFQGIFSKNPTSISATNSPFLASKT